MEKNISDIRESLSNKSVPGNDIALPPGPAPTGHQLKKDLQEPLTQATKFLEALFGQAESGYLSLWRKSTKESHHFELSVKLPPLAAKIRKVAERALEMAATTDVYFGVGLREKDFGQEERGTTDGVVAIPGLWFDLDVAGPGHKATNLPATVEDAWRFLEELELFPSLVVHSGGGLHIYWLFREIWFFHDDGERQIAAATVEGWQAHVRERAQVRGWTVDKTADLARVLRLPGTLNYKTNPPVPVRLLDFRGDITRYNPTDFKPYRGTVEVAGQRATPPVPDVVPEGQRNTTLTSLAGSMHRRGMSYEAILAALLAENREKCQPPLNEQEVRDIITSVIKYEPEGVEPEVQQHDWGHALVLRRAFANRYRWATHRRSWLEWTGQVWQPLPEERISKVAADTLHQNYVAELANTKDKNRIGELTSRIREACTFARISGALSFLKGWDGILTKPEEWDKLPRVFNVANGTLDLRTGSLRSHDPADLLTKLAPVKYDPGATGSTWAEHLNMFLPDANIRRQVQRDLGISLVGATLEEILPIWFGTGANGKTTTARVLQAICGNYSLQAAPRLLVAAKHDRHPTEIADLCGSRLVFSVEIDEGKKLAEALVKDLTGGDRKKARFMHADFFEFEQTFTIVLIVNHKPAIFGSDEGIWRRIRLIPWQYRVTPERRRPQEEIVPELISEGSAILNWLLAGLKDWQTDPRWVAPEVEAATTAYREEEDRLAGFLSDSCDLGVHFTVPVGKIYTVYTSWCATASEEAISKIEFGKLLKQRGITQDRARQGLRKWQGLRLRVTKGDKLSVPP